MVLNETSTAIVSIDELQGQGINASDIQKLRAAGICSITIRGLSEIKVEKIKEAAGKIVSLGGAEGKAAYIDTEGTFRPDR
ncbi:unnamed protein product [Wickerhamomyces anomalus]